jgi:hypothetical protein
MTVTSKVHFAKQRAGKKRIEAGAEPPPTERVPHVARLMALAIHLDQLLREGKVKDYAEIARLGHVSRARVTQIMNLLNLAPDIQERLMIDRHVAALKERDVRPIQARWLWAHQRKLWQRLTSASSH